MRRASAALISTNFGGAPLNFNVIRKGFKMNQEISVTLDTNVFGPVASHEDYPDHPEISACMQIRGLINENKFFPYVSEASLSLEALDHSDRIDKFIREWATKTSGMVLPSPSPTRIKIVERALQMGVRVLHVPRIAIGAFVNVPSDSWAKDSRFPTEERQKRHSRFIRSFPDIGPVQIKELGASLVQLHGLDTSRVIDFLGWPKPAVLIWSKGIIAEFDDPKMFNNQKQFTKHIREIIGEWADHDILASHYAYSFDYFCTCDMSKSTGIKGILHESKRTNLESEYGIKILTPSELVSFIS